ncbi:hypothetical protein D8S93_21240 [Vibrio sp. VGrn 2]|uniref:hypothetical protein n=1 Tax=Vibrio sp. VGrn 2 TaxID=2419839 RepID=UPI00128CB553|nr:hypothetical protein [Vibrio sp. VGrn 2]MPS41131.1 hypothetical protein [Vibrio sp. VGrn 2]
MLTIDRVDYYYGCTTSTFIEHIRRGELTSTEVNFSNLSFEERLNYLDKLRNIHAWILFQDEGCIEYITAKTAFSNSNGHVYLYDFDIQKSKEWMSITSNFNRSIGNISKKANRKNAPKWVATVLLDYLLISFIFYFLVKLGVSEILLSNPVESVVNYLVF